MRKVKNSEYVNVKGGTVTQSVQKEKREEVAVCLRKGEKRIDG